MDFVLDKKGVVAVRFDAGKYMHVLPVTKYQFERYIWEKAPDWVDYEEIVNETGRISPDEVTEDNIKQALLTRISFEEAVEISSWFGGRLPTADEWEKARDEIFDCESLFKDALAYCRSKMGETKPMNVTGTAAIDVRVVRLLERLVVIGIKRTDLRNFGELVSKNPSMPFRNLYVNYVDRRESFSITGDPRRKTRLMDSGFCGLIESHPKKTRRSA